MDNESSRFKLGKAIGPGLLMAGAAIGVSHLVQSTRAGANYGTQLIIVILLVNCFKYPFFEYGHRYAVATGESLIHGYRRLGLGYLYAFLFLNFISAIISIAAVTFVTAGLAHNLLDINLSETIYSVGLMVICAAIIIVGHYKWLDYCIKAIMALLFIATVMAFIVALAHGPVAEMDYKGPSAWNMANLGFIIALMGWMPAPIELSVWQSLWILANEKSKGRKTSFKEAMFDFNFGFSLTVVLAIMFLMLGYLVFYGSGVELERSGTKFATQIVKLYTHYLGEWATPVIAIAAFTAMFSTSLTVIDAYPRSLAVGLKLVYKKLRVSSRHLQWMWVGIGCLISLIIINSFLERLTALVDLATTIAFLSGPVFAFLNYRLITSPFTPEEFRPGRGMRIISILGLVYFISFGIIFIIIRFFWV